MIELNESIEWMLNNIKEKVDVIDKDFHRNGKTHCNYIIEKLGSAKRDLDSLYNIAKSKFEELESSEQGLVAKEVYNDIDRNI